MKNFTEEYRALCFEFYEASGMYNNALKRLPMCTEARRILELQYSEIVKCAEKLRLLQKEELYEKGNKD